MEQVSNQGSKELLELYKELKSSSVRTEEVKVDKRFNSIIDECLTEFYNEVDESKKKETIRGKARVDLESLNRLMPRVR